MPSVRFSTARSVRFSAGVDTTKSTLNTDGATIIEVILGLAIVALSILIIGAGFFVPEDAAVRALSAHGFTDVEILDRDVFFIFGCGRGDEAKFEATATNPRGQRVEVDVCVGWPLKNATVRIP